MQTRKLFLFILVPMGGRVWVSISDKKMPKRLTLGPRAIDYFEPEITTISDYCTFGSPMPTRTWSDPNAKYKYGFNGKEKDNEINVDGGDYDFGARIYDSRLGRWLSLDPFQLVYPNLTPYNGMGNNPIIITDPSGQILQIKIDETTTLTYKDGKLYNSDGTDYVGTNEFANTVFNDIKLLTNTETGTDLVNSIANNETKTVTIMNFVPGHTSAQYDVQENILYTNNKPINLPVQDGEKPSFEQSCPTFITLGHELAHAKSDLLDCFDGGTWVRLTGTGQQVFNDEKYACHIENKLRAENCMLLRSDYTTYPTLTPNGAPVPMSGPNTSTIATHLIDLDGASIHFKKVADKVTTEYQQEFTFGGFKMPAFKLEFIQNPQPYNYKSENACTTDSQ